MSFVRAYLPVAAAALQKYATGEALTESDPVFVVCARTAAVADVDWPGSTDDIHGEDLEAAEYVTAVWAAHHALEQGQQVVAALSVSPSDCIAPATENDGPLRHLTRPCMPNDVVSWYLIEQVEEDTELTWFGPDEIAALTDALPPTGA